MTFLEIMPGVNPAKDPRERIEQFTVVRVGDVIATFQKLDLGRSPSFPPDLIKKQAERLGKAQGYRQG